MSNSPSTTHHAPTPAEVPLQEAQLLADLRCVLGPDVWTSLADELVPQYLGRGMSNLIYQGDTRQQRQALVAWSRFRLPGGTLTAS